MELVAGVLIRPGLLLELVTGLCFHAAVLLVEAVREVGCCDLLDLGLVSFC